MPGQKEDLERTKEIRKMRQAGSSWDGIGEFFGISRERVRQVWIRNNKRRHIDDQVKRGVLTREEARERYGEGLSKGGV